MACPVNTPAGGAGVLLGTQETGGRGVTEMLDWVNLPNAARLGSDAGIHFSEADFFPYAIEGHLYLSLRLSGITQANVINGNDILAAPNPIKKLETLRANSTELVRMPGVFRIDSRDSRLFLELAYQAARTGHYSDDPMPDIYFSLILTDDQEGPCTIVYPPPRMTVRRLFSEEQIVVKQTDLDAFIPCLKRQKTDTQILDVLRQNGGNTAAAGRMLGMSRQRVAAIRDRNKPNAEKKKARGQAHKANDPFNLSRSR